MKNDYDGNLYRAIANFQLNEIVQVKNRKGTRFAIHITDITKLSWQELQLLMPEGPDRFSKMVLLYEQHRNHKSEPAPHSGIHRLSRQEIAEINAYIKIFQDNNFSEHFQVNEYITINCLWDAYPTIRSLNDHGEFTDIPGIQPKYFEAICRLLGISGGDGRPLDAFREY